MQIYNPRLTQHTAELFRDIMTAVWEGQAYPFNYDAWNDAVHTAKSLGAVETTAGLEYDCPDHWVALTFRDGSTAIVLVNPQGKGIGIDAILEDV